MKDSHSFSVAVAVEVGVNEAILLQHLVFLQKSNCPPDGDFSKVWVRRSTKSLQITYPYFSQKELVGALGRLEKSGNIESQINNESAYDRAKSYRTTEQGLVLVGEIAFDKRENDISQKGKSRFPKRANEDLTKGQMSSKEDYTDIVYPVSTVVVAKNEFSPPTADDETLTVEAQKNGRPSNGARRDLGDELAEFMAAEYGVKVVTVPSAEAIPDTLGKSRKEATKFGAFKPFDLDSELSEIAADYKMREAFTLARKVPKEKFEGYFADFSLEARAREGHKTRRDLRDHFLNYAQRRHNAESQAQKPKPNGAPNPISRPSAEIIPANKFAPGFKILKAHD